MFNNKKDFNEITTVINLKRDYEHPRETAARVHDLLNVVYKYFDSFYNDNFKKSIDIDILKSLVNKMEKNLNHLQRVDNILDTTKETYKKCYKDVSEIVVSTYAIPTSWIEVTLSELIIMHRTLEFCTERSKELSNHIYLPWGGNKDYYYAIKQIQEHLNSRLGYALLNSVNCDRY